MPFEQFDFSKYPDREKFGKLDKAQQKEIEEASKDEAYAMNDEFEKDGKEKKSEIETVEKELSPEVIEMIMGKVQDVNTKGIGYHVLRNYTGHGRSVEKREEILASVFKNGLFSGPGNISDFLNDYRKKLKEKDVNIQFNIVGRNGFSNSDDGRIEIINSEYARRNDGLIFLFDLSKFEEIDNQGTSIFLESTNSKDTIKHNQYAAVESLARKDQPVDDEFGFVLCGRMAPRYFKGVMISCAYDRAFKSTEEEDEFIRETIADKNLLNFRFGLKIGEEPLRSLGVKIDDDRLKEIKSKEGHYEFLLSQVLSDKLIQDGYNDEVGLKIFLDRAVKCMKKTYQNNSKLYIPIYDPLGNLVWPKKMTREEVKKFVEERDKKKEEEVKE